jgi:hypothetical protein
MHTTLAVCGRGLWFSRALGYYRDIPAVKVWNGPLGG